MAFYGLNLPSDMLDEEKFKSMAAKDKKKYTKSVLRKILDLNSNGITISQISKAIGYFNRPNMWHHLENMVTTREAYSLDFGKTTLYYPNGKMVHPLFSDDVKIGEKLYSFFLVINDFGEFMYVQEKKRDRMGIVDVCGGLILPLDFLGDVIKNIKDAEKIASGIIEKGVDKNVRVSKG